MPRRPQRPCSYPGCPNRCDGQYCEEHSKQMNRRYCDRYLGQRPGASCAKIRVQTGY